MIARMQLEEERRKGRWMLLACAVLGFFCLVLFKDRWPDDVKGAIIKFLDDGGSRNGANSSTKADSSKEKPILPQYSRDDPASGYATDMSEYLNGGKQSKHTIKKSSNDSKDSISENIAQAVSGESETLSPSTSSDRERPRPKGAIISKTQVVPEPTDEQKEVSKEEALMAELEQHLDNISKYLKWNLPFKHGRDVPFFWAIPLTGVSLLDEVYGRCYGLVQAADQASHIVGHEQDKILNVVTDNAGGLYVNVDMGSLSGINRAKELQLVTSNVPDIIRSSYFYETAILFQDTFKYGKCFTMVRDPIDRAVDVFRKLRASSTNPVFQNMTLEEYVKSKFIEDNWLVRFLSNELDGTLEKRHLELAQHILGRKCLVGLTEKFDESIERFTKYYGWSSKISKEALSTCEENNGITKLVQEGSYTDVDLGEEISKEVYMEGTELHTILTEKNNLDIQLYEYAKALFHRQELYT